MKSIAKRSRDGATADHGRRMLSASSLHGHGAMQSSLDSQPDDEPLDPYSPAELPQLDLSNALEPPGKLTLELRPADRRGVASLSRQVARGGATPRSTAEPTALGEASPVFQSPAARPRPAQTRAPKGLDEVEAEAEAWKQLGTGWKDAAEFESPVSLRGLDELDDMDTSEPGFHEPQPYHLRRADPFTRRLVPVTFANKRCEAEWSRMFGEGVFEAAFAKGES